MACKGFGLWWSMQKNQGQAAREKWCSRCLRKPGRVKAEETQGGSLFQTWDEVDEKDSEVAIDVFVNCADTVIEEDGSDREGMYLGSIWARYNLPMVQYLGSSCSDFKLIIWQTESQCRSIKTGMMWQYHSSGILNQLKTSRLLCRCACKKRITIVEPRADASIISRSESRLLLRLLFLLLQWYGMNECNECGAEPECGNMMPYMRESLGKHLDFS